ncbi:MAG TPA: tRNA pseudouridine(55) synthase TruB [Saprospiraceae bacterium]|nr:tRNA pseudouridine(55) synthase TruB [Saprospiraceae bacterium]HNE62208.1 tRNA pseudouridine(55) synthase TruB [Saprospiraceae bacterium]HNM53564.1 tRNA pseudouridine(55) synthase TruB [Saprospiraceae bacterium]HNN67430.1 tRNA pseudouridine(55) synthase TruB [Saprospiraceae bacterium]
MQLSHLNINHIDFKAGAVILVNKPYGKTSFFAVELVKRALKKFTHGENIKIGHAGTLDPLASGLLIMCTGKMTRNIQDYQSLDKKYSGIIRLGASTPSYDLETEINETRPFDHLSETALYQCAERFVGSIEMVPPIHSAVKINGKRSYLMARQGHQPELKPRTVQIHQFKIDPTGIPDIRFEVICSKGTYIRSLAHEFGLQLDTRAHLAELKREAIGHFTLSGAFDLDELVTLLRSPSEAEFEH